MRKAVGFLGQGGDLPEGVGYTLKRRLLGPPMVNEQLSSERLSTPLALGVLSCDGISSANYGSELILHELLPFFGLVSFTILLPMTGVILFGILIVVLSYREVVSVYTRAGGSYVVARENFGPRVAQVAAVALMIDYVVTVAVQTAAGSAAVLSTFPALGRPLGDTTTLLLIAVVATVIMAYVNLRGVRENGKTFALPTYLFSGSVGLMILVGLARELFGGGLSHVTWHAGTVSVGHWNRPVHLCRPFLPGPRLRQRWFLADRDRGRLQRGERAAAPGEQARPADPDHPGQHRRVPDRGHLLDRACHPRGPLQERGPHRCLPGGPAHLRHSTAGRVLYFLVQAGAITILFTGGNTSFSGFPFLSSFVAEDSFLPRWLSKRGHRLVFSNGIIVLTVLAVALLLVVGANTNNLVPFYAIGVFTGFSMAGFGMVRYHTRMKESGWRWRRVINFVAGVFTALVVVIFAVAKFTEGAWLVVIVFPIGVYAFIRLNREYRMESRVLERIGDRPTPPEPPKYTRRTVYVLVDSFDLATIAALRYARSLRPTTLRAVHFVIDPQEAEQLREEWSRTDRGVVLDFVDCPDRRVARCAAELASAEAAQPGTHVTVVLPRRSYSPLLGRLLHDRTADKIAGVVSRIPHVAATIVPFDVRSRLEVLHARQVAHEQQKAEAIATAAVPATDSARPRRTGWPSPGHRHRRDASGPGGGGRRSGPGDGDPAVPAGGSAERAADAPRYSGRPPPATRETSRTAKRPRSSRRRPATARRLGARAGSEAEPPSPDQDTGLPGEVAEAHPSTLRALLRGRRGGRSSGGLPPPPAAGGDHRSYDRPAPSAGVSPIGSLTSPGRATVEGRIRAVEIRPVERNSVLAAEIVDSTGDLTALFYGRSHIPGIICGARVRFRGPVGLREEGPVMINPAYELLFPGTSRPEDGEDSV